MATAVATALFGPPARPRSWRRRSWSRPSGASTASSCRARASGSRWRATGSSSAASTDQRAGVPGNALRAQAAWACLLVLSGSYSDLLKYVISADLLFFVLLVLAVVVLRRRRPEWPRPFRLPGGALFPLLYAAGGGALILLLLSANPRTTWPGYLIVGAGVPVYALWRRRGAARADPRMSEIAPEIHDLADGAAVVEYRGARRTKPTAPPSRSERRCSPSGSRGCATPSPARARSSSRSIRGAFPTRPSAARSGHARPLSAPRPPRRHEIPVLYGVETGADLAELAAHAGMSPEELCRRHAEGEYTVAFLGFAPGWAYLSGLDPALHAPRLPTPRPRVPAGSVAIGGPYTGVYPSATPGGWRLIGRAAVRLFDEEAEPPALFAPGDLVRFAAVAPGRFAAMEAEIAAASSRVATSPGGRPASAS